MLHFSFINNVYTRRGEGGSQDVLGQEGFAEAEARGNGTYHRDERVPDGYLTNGIAGQQFIIEGKADGRDTYQHEQIKQSEQGDVGQRAPHQQAGDDEQGTTQAQTVAGAHKHIHALVNASRHQSGKGTAQGIEYNHAITQQGERATTLAPQVERQDTAKTDGASKYLTRGEFIALKEQAGQQHQREHTERIKDGSTTALTMRQTDIKGGVMQRGIQ